MATIQPGRKAGRHKGSKRAGAEEAHRQADAFESALRMAEDELGSIADTLASVPEMEAMVDLADEAQRVHDGKPGDPVHRDRVANLVFNQAGFDIDAPSRKAARKRGKRRADDGDDDDDDDCGSDGFDDGYLLSYIHEAECIVHGIVCAAAWRVKRLKKALAVVRAKA